MSQSPRLEAAVSLALELHRSQTRKGGGIPYIGHLFSVMSLVAEAGGDEDEQVAALLHDAVEDQGGAPTLDRIRASFGEAVAAIVDACTDTDQEPKPPWRPRKQASIDHLRVAPLPVLRVAAADKLHNLRSTVFDARTLGPAVFERFSGGRDGTLWYYRELSGVFAERLPGPLADELADALACLERLVADG